jgi:oligosaccharide translocation protein RFT1
MSGTHEPTDMMKAFRVGGSYLMLLQLLSRLGTFILNNLLLRFTTPAIFGIANVPMELLLGTILFLSREGIRCAVLRMDQMTSQSRLSDQQKLQMMVNMGYVPMAVGGLWTCGVAAYHLLPSSQPSGLSWVSASVLLYSCAAWVELASEPLYVVAQYQLQFKVRVGIEGTALLVKCVTTLGVSVWLYNLTDGFSASAGLDATVGVMAFAVAQLLYAVVVLVGYVRYYTRLDDSAPSCFPQRVTYSYKDK